MQFYIIPCGTLKVKADEMIRPYSLEQVSRTYPLDEKGIMTLAMNALLLKASDRTLLLDPGCADFLPSRWSRTYGLEFGRSLEEQLVDHGVLPGEITDVVFTHLHFDHGSGAFARSPGTIGKRFPNARYHVLQEHFNYSSKPDRSEAGTFFTRLFRTVDRIFWLEDWTETWIEFLPVNGHTRGMVVPVIHTDGEDIYYLTDLIPMSIFFEKQIYSGYDLDPEVAVREKCEFLDGISRPSRFILFHDPLKDSSLYP